MAVELAARACELSAWEDAECLRALAAACAEAGRRDEAIQWAEKALELAAPAQQERCRPELEQYRRAAPGA